jgi:hypothetical protein
VRDARRAALTGLPRSVARVPLTMLRSLRRR